MSKQIDTKTQLLQEFRKKFVRLNGEDPYVFYIKPDKIESWLESAFKEIESEQKAKIVKLINKEIDNHKSIDPELNDKTCPSCIRIEAFREIERTK